jgi:dihydrofolate synthase / folylpolyglutamate synthase
MFTFQQAEKYLEGFVNLERVSFGDYGLSLDRVGRLFDTLGIVHSRLKVIHIAGTKGKGSTAAFCAYILAASGYRVGLYTSPHFLDSRERIQIVRPQTKDRGLWAEMIPKKDLAEIVGVFRPVLEKLKKKKCDAPTFFEVYTAIALEYFIREKTDYVVLETGLGGRLDATTVVKPLVGVITHIGYDHMDKLGNTFAKIAGEKAGIIKKGTPVICAAQNHQVSVVIAGRAKELKAPLKILGRDFGIKAWRAMPYGSRFDFYWGDRRIKDVQINLRGSCQAENACLALAAAMAIEKNAEFKKGLTLTESACRFQTINQKPVTIVDVAHNVCSFAALQDSLRRYYPGKKIILVFGACKDKDVSGMLSNFPYFRIILCGFDSPRAFDAFKTKERLKLTDAFVACDLSRAYEIAKELYDKNSLILIAGSFLLAAEAIRECAKGTTALKVFKRTLGT